MTWEVIVPIWDNGRHHIIGWKPVARIMGSRDAALRLARAEYGLTSDIRRAP